MELGATNTRVDCKQDRGVWHLTLCPRKGESQVRLDAQLLAELYRGLRTILGNTKARAIVLQSASPEYWCSGMDLGSALEATTSPHLNNTNSTEPTKPLASTTILPALKHYAKVLSILSQSPLPVLAKVQGQVQGGGLGLLSACDRILALNDLRISLPETLVGLTPAMVLPVLQRRIGPKAARWLAMSGEICNAATAQQIGLVDLVYGEEDTLDKALRSALKSIRRRSSRAIAEVAEQIRVELEPPSQDLESKLLSAAQRTQNNLNRPAVQQAIRDLNQGYLPNWNEE